MPRRVMIQIRRGLESAIGTLAVGELGYCTDTSKLYIGSVGGNVLLVAAQSAGDMLKSIYDTNNDGKVDFAAVADSVPWSGVAGKPTALPAAGGAADAINIPDTRSVADKPSELQAKKITAAFKSMTAVGNPPVTASGSYVYILNVIGWSANEGSGGWPVQIAVGGNGLAIRQGVSADAWSGWTALQNQGPMTWNQLKGV